MLHRSGLNFKPVTFPLLRKNRFSVLTNIAAFVQLCSLDASEEIDFALARQHGTAAAAFIAYAAHTHLLHSLTQIHAGLDDHVFLPFVVV
ncbi:hypothetical protein QTP88_022371 [Uroleucon formosanum]